MARKRGRSVSDTFSSHKLAAVSDMCYIEGTWAPASGYTYEISAQRGPSSVLVHKIVATPVGRTNGSTPNSRFPQTMVLGKILRLSTQSLEPVLVNPTLKELPQ